MDQPTTIQAGQTLTARSACDSACRWTAYVISRKGNMVTLTVDRVDKEPRRRKVVTDHEGNEVVYALGRYSMAPIFRA